MKKYRLTDEHRKMLPDHTAWWIRNIMSTKAMHDRDRREMVKAIHGMYTAANLVPPINLVFVPSPFVGAFAAGAAAWIWHQRGGRPAHEAATSDATWAATEAATSAATRAATSAATRAVTWDATEAATRAATWDATRDATEVATWAATSDATWDATWAATSAATRAATRDATEVATWAATSDATWDATWAVTEAATSAATRAATPAATRAATEAATRDATRDATWDATWAATEAATRDATMDATRDAMRAVTEDATRAVTEDATRAATDNATEDATWDATRDATEAATRDATWWTHHCDTQLMSLEMLRCADLSYRMANGGNHWDCSFLSFFYHIAALDLPPVFEHYEKAAIHGSWRWVHEKFCIVSDRPERLLVDDLNRPHCEDGPFCRWRDGSALYAVHGVRVPAWVIERPDLIDTSKIDDERNAEVRRVMIERFPGGVPAYMQAVGRRPLASDHYGTLWSDGERLWVEVVDAYAKPGTVDPSRYVLDIDPECRPLLPDGTMGEPQQPITPRAAVASTFGLRAEQYNPQIQT